MATATETSESTTAQVRLLTETAGNEKKFFTIRENGEIKLISWEAE